QPSVSRIQLAARQRQKQSHARWHAVEKPACCNVGEQADADLGHGDDRGLGDDAVPGPDHDAETTAHADVATPADNGVGIAVYGVVKPVLGGKETFGLGAGLALGGTHGAVQAHDVATGAERLLAAAVQHDADDIVTLAPLFQL